MKRSMSLRGVVCSSLAVVLLGGAAAAGQPPKDPKVEAAEKEIVKLRADVAKAKADLAAREKALADSIRAAEADKVAAQKATADAATARKQADAAAATAKAATDAAAVARQTLQKQLAAEKVQTREALAKLDAAMKDAGKLRTEAAALRQEAVRQQTARMLTQKALAEATRESEAFRREAAEVRAAARKALDVATSRALEADTELASVRLQVSRLQAELAALQKKAAKGPKEAGDTGTKVPLQGRARIVVEVPAPDAQLYVNGRLCPATEGKVVREFLTPPLEPNRRYFYDLRVQTMRDGRPVVSNRRVVFRANTEQHVDFRPSSGAH